MVGFGTPMFETLITSFLGTSHCQALHSVSDNDLEEIKQTKIKAKELIALWISGSKQNAK